MIMLSIGVFILFPGSLNNDYYQKVMSKYAYNYNIIEWINQNVPRNAVVVSSAVRSHSLYKNIYYAYHELTPSYVLLYVVLSVMYG